MDKNVSVRPYVIAWVAKDENIYQLLRAVPVLLENAKENVIVGC
jgi:hypothetical protein